MAKSEDDLQFSLEEILAEFGRDTGAAPPGKQIENPEPQPAAPEEAAVPEPEKKEIQEEPPKPEPPPTLEDKLKAMHVRVETADLEKQAEERRRAAVQAAKTAQKEKPKREAPPVSDEFPWPSEGSHAAKKPQRKPLTFPTERVKEKHAAEKAEQKLREQPAEKSVKPESKPVKKPPVQKDAPWRTEPERPSAKRPAPAAEGKRLADEPRQEQRETGKKPKREKRPHAVPLEDEAPRKPKVRLPYDRINRPADDAGAMGARLGKRLGSMAVRLMVMILPVLAAIYLTGAAKGVFPVPMGLTFESVPKYYYGALAGLQLIVLLLAFEVTASGLWRLIRLRPTLDTVVTLSALVSEVYCVLPILSDRWTAGFPYICVTVLTCFFAMLSKRQRYEWLRRSYKALSLGTAPSGVKLYSDGKVQRMALRTQSGVDVDLTDLAEYDDTERFACYYSPIVLVLCAAAAFSATVAKGWTDGLIWSLSAVLAVAAPAGLLLSSSAPGKKLGKALYTSGSMIVNASAAGKLAKAASVVVRDADLYPTGSVYITGMKIADNQDPEVVVGCAASILQEVGGGLSKAFQEFARQQYIVPAKAKELRFFDTRGVSATVAGRYIQLGTASYLMRMGIDVTEGLKLKNSIFIAIDSRFAGIFSMRYEAQTPVYSAFGLLRQAKIRPVLALRDTTQTQNAVENRFDLRRNTTFVPDLEERLSYSAGAFGREEETLALLTRDGLLPLAEVLSCAKKWKRAARASRILGTVCAVVGVLILAFLTGRSAIQAAEPFNVLVYLLLWALPAKMIRGIITRI